MSFLWANALRLVCVLALLGVTIAHRPAHQAQQVFTQAELQNYVLPDGSVPELCLKRAKEGTDGSAAYGCEACRLIGAILLPVPTEAEGHLLVFSKAPSFRLAAPQQAKPLATPTSAPRGPPTDIDA